MPRNRQCTSCGDPRSCTTVYPLIDEAGTSPQAIGGGLILVGIFIAKWRPMSSGGQRDKQARSLLEGVRTPPPRGVRY